MEMTLELEVELGEKGKEILSLAIDGKGGPFHVRCTDGLPVAQIIIDRDNLCKLSKAIQFVLAL